MILENLIPFLVVSAVVFGLLWIIIETGAKLGAPRHSRDER